MSGSELTPSVTLFGPATGALVMAIPEIETLTGRPVTLVGGLAVLCRLSRAYRATSDVDTANRRAKDERSQLSVLLDSGARRQGPSGVRISTSRGEVQVDVLEVSDDELKNLPDDPNDRLHVMSHAWGIASASSMVINVADAGTSKLEAVNVRVAAPGPLIAMKIQAVMNRSSAKEATDLLDIVRLMLDAEAGPVARRQLGEAHPQIAEDAALHAELWFVRNRIKTANLIKMIPEGRDVDQDTVAFVGEILLAELSRKP